MFLYIIWQLFFVSLLLSIVFVCNINIVLFVYVCMRNIHMYSKTCLGSYLSITVVQRSKVLNAFPLISLQV